jgi:hypothetical protein
MIAATTVTGVIGTPAFAADPPEGPCDYAAGTLTTAVTARALTTHLAVASPYGAVRSAALTALRAPRGDIAVQEFIPHGWCQATDRAEQDAAMNEHIIARVLATHSYATSPWVYSAAEAASTASAAEKEYFVRSGLEEARAADQRARDEDGAYQRALAGFDRLYVAQMRDTAQGKQVKIAAAYALRDGASDSDIVEFYTYAWARSGKLDLERFQLTIAEQERRWLVAMDELMRTALIAQAAAQESSAKAQEAADAWASVADGAESSANGWLAAKQAADAQAAQWSAIYQLALNPQGGLNWRAMAKPARANRDSWERDSRNARDRVAYWQKILEDARVAEEAVRPVEG